MKNCPHDNRNCQPANLCGPCGGGLVRDGERVRVGMTFRDSVQQGIAAMVTDSVREQARTDHEAWKSGQPAGAEIVHSSQVQAARAQADKRRMADAAAHGARTQGSVDHFRERHAANDAAARATPAGDAYANLCADLQRGR